MMDWLNVIMITLVSLGFIAIAFAIGLYWRFK